MANLRRIWDYVIPALLSFYIVSAWYVATFEIGVGWLLRTKDAPVLAAAYLVAVAIMMFAISNAYLRLLTTPANHSIPAPDPPTALLNRTVPFECFSEDGNLEACFKGRCSGRWKPPRAHHCSTCGVCRIGFDHHCPWIGNCVTSRNKGDFLVFLLLTPIAISVASSMVITQVSSQFKGAYAVSTTDPWILENWWGWKWSWLCFGGPPGRYLTAVVLGYRELQREHLRTGGPADTELGAMAREPSLRLLFLVLIGIVLGLFTIGLSIRTIYDVGRGLTSVDTMRQAGLRDGHIKPRLVWIPSSPTPQVTQQAARNANGEDLSKGACCEVLPEERPYDLGWRRNLISLWETVHSNAHNGQYIIPTLNPEMLRRMRAGLVLR
ncbi:hypothetical protein FRB94_002723 [Tulasnella sp. JGI-2019a]|nr:hypothetical protein FRB94_002723 [Tulasnella sp. JGI-2019a]KAG9013345.1 hypothetical protein FRB93_000868 [Tulasnella sp. JGI-2019a]KAG9032928.1 hypothetical protein FRB95_000862 [Tulasnella sp. JGI-2019a]